MKSKFKQFKEDIIKNANIKLNKWRAKKMAKKDIDEIPDIEDREVVDSSEAVEPAEPTEPTESPKEESKVQLVTSEQLTQYKLDNLSLDIQDLSSKIQELIEILRKKK